MTDDVAVSDLMETKVKGEMANWWVKTSVALTSNHWAFKMFVSSNNRFVLTLEVMHFILPEMPLFAQTFSVAFS